MTKSTDPSTSAQIPTPKTPSNGDVSPGVAVSHHGVLAWMSNHPVAANLLLFVLLVGGIVGVFRTKQEVFPEFSLDMVVVQVPYPGASPAEVEQGIVLAAEEAIRGIEGVKRVTSTAQEGVGTASAELILGADPDKALSDIKSAIDRVTSFPEEAERPAVSLATRRREVISLIVSGDQDLRTLYALAEQARSGLLAQGGITQVEVSGLPPLEISVEISRENLEKYGFTLEEVARQISRSSLELPGGELETKNGKLLVRVADRRESGDALSDIVLRSTQDGAQVELAEIATIQDGFAETDQESFFNGKRAVQVTAYRVGTETPSSVAKAVRAYAEEFREELPESVAVSIWADDSEILDARINLLTSNAVMGLILVLIVLALFLELRLGFWVGVGIPTSFFGAFFLFPGLDLSINMVTLFGLIITLGLVVDDAIVVGEHAYEKMQQGLSPKDAAVAGVREMSVPVTFAVLTTMAAFAPMLFVPGTMGKIFKLLPLVVGAILVLSVIESFFILPAHVSHIRLEKTNFILRLAERVQRRMSDYLERFTRGPYRRGLERTLRNRYLAVAFGIASLLVTVGIVGGGLVPFSFFPELEGDVVNASVRLPYGTPISKTKEVQRALERAAEQATLEVGGPEFVRGMFSALGSSPGGGGPMGGRGESGSHLLSVRISLVPGEQREFNAVDFADAWKKALPDLVGIEALTISAAAGPGAGAPVAVQLSSSNESVLENASDEVEKALKAFDALTDIDNSFAGGKNQLDFHLLPHAYTLKLTGADVARQIRSAFFGAEALREQRGRSELKIMVRLPKAQRTSEYDLEDLRIRTPDGGLVPLSYVAKFERNRAATTIKREDGKRVIDISARLAPGVRSPQPVLDALNREIFPQLRDKYPRLGVSLVGEQRSQGEAFASLGQNFIFALFVIYALLAIPFRSYSQPLIIMSAIPFGVVGAVMGHLVMGYGLSLISMFGIIALSGVVVNDSLVLIDSANRARSQGLSPWDAIIFGGMRRLRPILLTSLTTFFGLMPMIFEKSMQARFLIPMAISLGFGVLFATLIALLLVPAFYLILEEAKGNDLHSPTDEPR